MGQAPLNEQGVRCLPGWDLCFSEGDGRSKNKQKRKTMTYCDKCSEEDFLGDDVSEGVSIHSAPQ